MTTSLLDAIPMPAVPAQVAEVGASAQPAAAQPPVAEPPVPVPPTDAQPTPPAAPVVTGNAVGVSVPGIGTIVPMTRDQLRAFDRITNELSDQLTSARGRREDLVEELATTTSPVVIAGLEARIGVLDARLVSLEQQIAENGALKSSLAANLGSLSSQAPRTNNNNSSNGPFASWLGWAIFGMMAVMLLRSMRRGDPRPATAVSAESEARFVQLEQAIDTVAIEIERVSEGQRFVSKLLREGQPVPDFPPGRVPETVDVRRAEGSS